LIPESLELQVVTPERQMVREEVHEVQVPGRNGMDSVIYARRGRSQGHVQPHHRHTIIAIYGMLYPCPKLPPVANRTGIKNGQDDLVTLLM